MGILLKNMYKELNFTISDEFEIDLCYNIVIITKAASI